MDQNDLIKKYDVAVPSYTTYPTVPVWDTGNFSMPKWIWAVEKIFDETNASHGIGLYINLPSRSGNANIPTEIAADNYIRALIKEWELYCHILGKTPVLRQLHVCWGTSASFSPDKIRILLEQILFRVYIHPEYAFSFESSPHHMTEEHLRVFSKAGFRNLRYKVQDLNLGSQHAFHQDLFFENLQRIVATSLASGFTSIGFDVAYGLPYETTDSLTTMVGEVMKLRPGQITLTPYANLAGNAETRALYALGKQIVVSGGYAPVGMDLFALPSEPLYEAAQSGALSRNIMGYSTASVALVVGLGAGAISDAQNAYAQNLKKPDEYETQVLQNNLAVFRGHILTREDQLIKKCILDISCLGEIKNEQLTRVERQNLISDLVVMAKENLIVMSGTGLKVTDAGKAFVRNICYAFDAYKNDPAQDRSCQAV